MITYDETHRCYRSHGEYLVSERSQVRYFQNAVRCHTYELQHAAPEVRERFCRDMVLAQMREILGGVEI